MANTLPLVPYLVGECGPELFVPLNAGNRLRATHGFAGMHDGMWFIREGERQARAANIRAAVALAIVYAVVALAWWLS
jgi:hypothetical protein